ncbi:MAG: energy transducer TonB [Acidobacteriota bacterium]|nr:energy transducer TonB [Acidobacteriota bacterium]
MKFCPVCKTQYDEEILRFCTKDGTPLIEESLPNFTAMPSRNDLGEDTVIRRKTPAPIPSTAQALPDFDDEPERISSPRIVIPMSDQPVADQFPPRRENVRTVSTESIRRQLPPPRQSNTAMVVVLTILGTIILLGAGGLIFWALSRQNNADQNVNYNTNLNSIDVNLNTSLNTNQSVANSLADFNSNVNVNTNSNANSVANANTKTPTPTRTPTPTPDINANFNASANANVGNSSITNIKIPPPPPPSSSSATPTPRPTFSPSPRPSPSGEPSNRPVNAGILNSRAVNLPKPAYPPSAKQMHADGQVAVQVSVDEAGNVTAAKATSGNPLLRASAEAAARQSKFNPVRINNQAVPVNGVVLYNFEP